MKEIAAINIVKNLKKKLNIEGVNTIIKYTIDLIKLPLIAWCIWEKSPKNGFFLLMILFIVTLSPSNNGIKNNNKISEYSTTPCI